MTINPSTVIYAGLILISIGLIIRWIFSKTPRQKDEQWMTLGRVTMKRCPHCYYNWSEVNIKDCPSCGKGKPKAQGKI